MDVYNMVTTRIIEQLEKGYIPWKKPWASCLDGTFNRISRRPYSLLNQLLLSRGGEYATFKQWDQIGGKVKKGEKAEIVVFWKLQEAQEKDETGEIKIKKIPILRYYNVFHISQVTNVLPLPKMEEFDTSPIERAENALHNYIEREHITLSVGASDRAFYSPYTDSIKIPAITQFECAEEAILHSMGLETKETFQNSAAYIQNWLQVLKNDKKFIILASGKAEKAAKYILDVKEDKEEKEQEHEKRTI